MAPQNPVHPPRAIGRLAFVRLLGTTFLLLYCSRAIAEMEQRTPLSLPQALEMALRQGPDVIRAKSTLSQAQAQRLRGLSTFLPSLSLSQQNQIYHPVGAASDTVIAGTLVPGQQPFYANTVAANFQLTLFGGGKNVAGYHAAMHDLRGAEARLTSAVNGTFMRILDGYATLAKDQATIRAQEEILGLARDAAKLTESRFRHQIASRIEWNNSMQQALNAEMALSRARRKEMEDRESLLQEIGCDPTACILVPRQIPVCPAMEALDPLPWETDPQIQAARSDWASAKERVKAAHAAYWPTISLVAQYNGLGIDTKSPVTAFSATHGSNYIVGLAVNIPLLPMADTMAAVRLAEASVVYASGTYANTIANVATRERTAGSVYAEARRTAEIARRSTTVSENTSRLHEALVAGRQENRLDMDQAHILHVQTHLGEALAQIDLQLAAWALYLTRRPQYFAQTLASAAQGIERSGESSE